MTKRKRTELVCFKAVVVETETYDNGNGKLYHAVLDSMPKEPKRQAQFFGMEQKFKAGDIHIVTFSARVGRSKRKVKEQVQADIEAQRAADLETALRNLEAEKRASQTVN